MEPETVQTPTTGNETNHADEKPVELRHLGEVVKNQSMKIAVRVLEYKGRRFVDVRLMTLKGKRWQFEKAGITLNSVTFPDVFERLSANREHIEEMLNPLDITDP